MNKVKPWKCISSFHPGTLRKPLLVVLNKLDAVSEENAICWSQALERIPGVAAVLGYSKEDLRHRNFGDLQLGKEALIDAWARFPRMFKDRCVGLVELVGCVSLCLERQVQVS